MADYTQLQADMKAWLWRDEAELIARIPTLIALAHDRNNRNLRIRPMLVRAQFIGNDSRFVPLPGTGSEPSFLEMRSLRIQSVVNNWSDQLIQVSPEALRTGPTNRPESYCIHEEIEFNTPVSADNTLEMLYYAPFDALSDANPTNWPNRSSGTMSGLLCGALGGIPASASCRKPRSARSAIVPKSVR